jgi:hypothetical protein
VRARRGVRADRKSPPAPRPIERSASPTGCNTTLGVTAVCGRQPGHPALRAVRAVYSGERRNRTAGQSDSWNKSTLRLAVADGLCLSGAVWGRTPISHLDTGTDDKVGGYA